MTRYSVDDAPVFVIDQSRCIGCEACVQACMECGTHRGQSLIHLERIERRTTTQTAPMVCMHCADPTCAEVCPADAIKQTEGGIVQSALKPRCIGCSNCVLACPFGVPKMIADFDQMMKCDMCTDRTIDGLKPMCASVCPSQALWYGTIEEFADTRRGSLLRDFLFGRQEVRTKVYTVVDDVAAGALDVVGGATASWLDDPFGLDQGDDAGVSDEPVPVRPLWRRDFPYEAAAEDEVTRREFTRYLVVGAGAMAAGNVGIAAWTQLRSINTGEARPIVALADVSVGQTFLFRYPSEDDPAVLLRLDDRDVVAFSQKCTHLGCVVFYEAELDRWHCPCHEGNFETGSGRVMSGPPPRPLGRIAVELRDDGRIWALGRTV